MGAAEGKTTMLDTSIKREKIKHGKREMEDLLRIVV